MIFPVTNRQESPSNSLRGIPQWQVGVSSLIERRGLSHIRTSSQRQRCEELAWPRTAPIKVQATTGGDVGYAGPGEMVEVPLFTKQESSAVAINKVRCAYGVQPDALPCGSTYLYDCFGGISRV